MHPSLWNSQPKQQTRKGLGAPVESWGSQEGSNHMINIKGEVVKYHSIARLHSSCMIFCCYIACAMFTSNQRIMNKRCFQALPSFIGWVIGFQDNIIIIIIIILSPSLSLLEVHCLGGSSRLMQLWKLKCLTKTLWLHILFFCSWANVQYIQKLVLP